MFLSEESQMKCERCQGIMCEELLGRSEWTR